MMIKEFEALTLKDCLNQVRAKLGPEAVILETQKVRKGGVMGLGARDAVRIVAAVGVSVDERRQRSVQPASQAAVQSAPEAAAPTKTSRLPEPSVAASIEQLPPVQRSKPEHRAPNTEHRPSSPEDKLARLENELKQLKQGMVAMQQAVISAPAPQPAVPSVPAPPAIPFPTLHERLRQAEVGEELSRELVDSLPDLGAWAPQARDQMAETALRDLMAGRIVSGGPIALTEGKTKVVALVGPTGVGKTTTIAKLAAHYALIEKKKVALITLDTYRIAAVEQLKTYGQIIDIPVTVVHNQGEIAPALEAHAGRDLILIDTAGRSQKNVMQVSELKTLVDAAQCEAHLVLSASTKERDLYDQIARYGVVGVDRLLFTKLDETTTYGTLYTVAVASKLPVSYITTGQKVPEDIEVADGAKLAAIVMNSTIA